MKSKFLFCGIAALLGLASCGAGTTSDILPSDSSSTPSTSTSTGDESTSISDISTSTSTSDESKYQVSANYWTSNITQAGFFGANHNLTMNIALTSDDGRSERGVLENENGNLHIEIASEEVSIYVEPSDDSYFVYYQDAGEWKKESMPSSYMTTLAKNFVYFINPWLYSDFAYNAETHAYEKDSDRIVIGATTVELTDIAFKFEDSKLLSLTYNATKDSVKYNGSLTVSKWGSTSFTFPEVHGGGDVKPTSIELSASEINIKEGEKAALSATIHPENSDKITVTWTSSSTIAEVEQTGTDTRYVNIKGHAEGTAIITATIEGGISATCKVNIIKNESSDPVPAQSITITHTSLEMKVGDVVTFDSTILPLNATNRLVHWSVDKKGVVDLEVIGDNNKQCKVTATGKGTTTLTAIVTLGVEATCSITVTDAGGEDDPVYPTKIELSKSEINMKVGEETLLDATIYPADSVITQVTWSFNEVNLALYKVDNDMNHIRVVALKESVSTITAHTSNGIKANCEVTVAGHVDVNPTSISLSSNTLDLKVGDTSTLNATILPTNATNKAVRWSSSSYAVSVNASASDPTQAFVKAEDEGTATITATTSNGLTATCVVTVTAVEPVSHDEDLMGVTLKYKAFLGPLNYGEEGLTNEQVDDVMGDVQLSLFKGVIGEDGSVSGFEFEYYHKTNPMNGVYLGEYSVSDGMANGEVNAYYNFTSQKFSYGRGISYRNIVSNDGSLYLTYIDETNIEDYQSEVVTITTGMYAMSGYFMDANGKISGKGSAIFEKLDENPSHLIDLPAIPEETDISDVIYNKVFTYNSYESSNPLFSGNTKYDAAQQDATVSFFDDGTFEYHIFKLYSSGGVLDYDAIYRGTYSVDYSSDTDPVYGEDVYYIELNAKDYIQNNVVNPLRFKYFDFYYSVSENAIYSVIENAYSYETDGGVTYCDWIKQKSILTSESPERYVIPEYDNWDETLVAETLASLGYTDNLPKLTNVKEFRVASTTIDSCVLQCIFASNDDAASASANYARVIGKTFTQVTQYDPTAGDYVLFYFSPNNQYKVEWHNTLNIVQITVSNVVAKYPTREVNAFLSEHDITDTVPELTVEGASGYTMDASNSALYIYIDASLADGAVSYLISKLGDAHYTPKVVKESSYFISPNKQIGLFFIQNTYGFGIKFIDPSSLPETDYPAADVASYLYGTTDNYPDFTYINGASYKFEGPGGAYLDAMVTVTIDDYITESDYLDVFLPSLVAKLEGYKKYASIDVENDSGTSKTYSGDYLYLSPNEQIAIRIIPGKATYASDGTGSSIIVYKNYGIQYINLVTNHVTDANDGLPHLDEILASRMTTSYEVGDDFSFDGVLYAYYTNGGETKEVTPTTVSSPDMTTVGTKEVTLTYTEDGVTKEYTYSIYVSAKAIQYTYRNENSWDIFDARAQFKVWAWGGTYGEGQWVEITSIDRETKDFTFTLMSDCDGFIIVRLNPDAMPTDDYVWDVEEWNKTQTLTPTISEEGYVTFAFN